MSVDVYMRTGSNITHMAFECSYRDLYIYRVAPQAISVLGIMEQITRISKGFLTSGFRSLVRLDTTCI